MQNTLTCSGSYIGPFSFELIWMILKYFVSYTKICWREKEIVHAKWSCHFHNSQPNSTTFVTTFIDNLELCPWGRKWFNINDVIFCDVTTQWGSNNSSPCQLCVLPPRALTHSWHRPPMDATRLAWNACGISCQTSCRASPSPCSVTGWFGRCLNRPSISSHTCSIGDKSGDIEGQDIIDACLRKFMMRRATCGLALSCWKVMLLLWPRTKGGTCGLTTSSR